MIAQADSRKWMACLYNSFLFMEAKIMKMAKKLLAVVLTGVMAVSMLTGCALGDKVAEKKLLDTLNVYGKADSIEYKSKDTVTISGTKYELKDAASKIKSCVSDSTIKDQDVADVDALKTKLDTELAKIDAKRSTYESEEAYAEARSAAINSAVQSQWRNKCIDSTYEPGSTYKPITLAAALEEGKVTKNSTFYCSGSTHVQGWNKAIYCSNHSGHGQQTLIEAVGHSCNPAFISMGLSVGTETYYKYLKSFGLMDKTGIDMIGEVKGIFQDEKSFNSQVVSLASYSFGQTFNVTPIELIRAQAACVNGGYLYQPYIVEQVLDEDGNQIELKEDEDALDTFNLARMDADDERQNRYADDNELADAGFDYVADEEVDASYDGDGEEF